MTNQNLFTPHTLGSLALSNRVVLSPLTRNRAGPGFKCGAPLSAFNPAPLYGGGAAGYIDYPTLAESGATAS